MVYIQKLILENFKSFSGKNEIKLMNKLNLIIGPNGSGKSNISEAISFVLGKMSKKGLRTDKLSNLIFNGGKKGKPAKSASVKLVFSNVDKLFPVEENYVEIGRIIESTGKSDYLINGKKATRTEIINLLDYVGLGPDGFNMIMQGRIARFIDMGSLERGKIIEKISGISTYEEKKERTIKELEKVNSKIKDTNVILKERLKHLDELKKEKKQAEKFKSVKDQIRTFKAKLLFKKLHNKINEKDKIINDIAKLRKHIEDNVSFITTNSLKIKTITEEINGLNKFLGANGIEKKNILTEKIFEIKNEINKFTSNIKSHKNEINRIKDRLVNLNKNIFNIEKEKNTIKEDIENYENEINNLNKSLNALKQNSKNKNEISYFELKTKVNELKEKLLDDKKLLNELTQKQEFFNKYKDYQEQLINKTDLMEKIMLKLNQETTLNSGLAYKVNQANEKLQGLKIKFERLSVKKDMYFKNAGYGIKELLNQNIKGVNGIVSGLCKTDKRYELPLRVASGNKLLNIVVDNENIAQTCINFLRQNKLGVVSFLPLNKIKGFNLPSGFLNYEGVIDFAINLIDFNIKYKTIFEYIFRDTLIVKNMESAKKIGIGRIRMVTLQGDIIEKSGAIRGGFRNSKKEITIQTTDNNEIDSVKIELEKISEYYQTLTIQKGENDANITNLREKRVEVNSEINNINLLLSDLANKSKNFDIRKIGELKNNIEKNDEALMETKKNLNIFESKFNLKTFEQTKKQIEEFESKLSTLRVNKGIKESRLKRIDEKELNELIKTKNSLTKEMDSFTLEIKDFEKKLKINNSQLETFKKEELGFETKLNKNYEKKEKLEKKIKDLTLKIEEKKIHISDKEEKIKGFDLLKAEIIGKIEGLKYQYTGFEDLNIKQVNLSVNHLEHEIFLLEKKMEGMGNVNLKALDVYNTVEESFNEVKTKMELLKSEYNSIFETIKDIETKKISSFIDTFKEIKINFERIFSLLSPGGIANLIIENKDNPIEGGIDITARPKGKKTLNLQSMSGGEKTMTALSFIFALQEYDPAPFYIMDEVDAALDKENATIVGKICKEYSNKAQFLIISHNDNIISEADYLYGISMDLNGISKITTLKLT